MNLSQSQIESVKNWLAEGCDVAQVQKRMASELGVNMRYMDVRFLIDDIGAQIAIPEPKEEPTTLEPPANKSGDVHVSLDSKARPGSLASGSVIFSDGEKSDWYVRGEDGGLGLIPPREDYIAPQEDLPIFQQKLQELLADEESQGENENAIGDDSLPSDPNKKAVEVSLSKIQRPDCLAFGDVVFSDGMKAEWRIDRTGRLGIVPSIEGQKPPQEDMAEFQHKLQDLLKSMY